ncbi:hypothetical protein CRG98_028614 [Punica granatum]|uniref:SUEL-type lectin domain-containing protein n=1 Tax=Punica granatum TaxID=22663 RepID=A0A2I0J427_PUNGR|nr:hypothetical protein CRG98_028614 [Punica granatum]
MAKKDKNSVGFALSYIRFHYDGSMRTVFDLFMKNHFGPGWVEGRSIESSFSQWELLSRVGTWISRGTKAALNLVQGEHPLSLGNAILRLLMPQLATRHWPWTWGAWAKEWGGDPNGISLVRRDIVSVCADIYEWQPTLINYEMQTSGKVKKHSHPKAHLSCSPGQKISKVKSASFGTPQGACGSFREESCHAFHSYDVFQKIFGGDPCPSVMKKLSVEVITTKFPLTEELRLEKNQVPHFTISVIY